MVEHTYKNVQEGMNSLMFRLMKGITHLDEMKKISKNGLIT